MNAQYGQQPGGAPVAANKIQGVNAINDGTTNQASLVPNSVYALDFTGLSATNLSTASKLPQSGTGNVVGVASDNIEGVLVVTDDGALGTVLAYDPNSMYFTDGIININVKGPVLLGQKLIAVAGYSYLATAGASFTPTSAVSFTPTRVVGYAWLANATTNTTVIPVKFDGLNGFGYLFI